MKFLFVAALLSFAPAAFAYSVTYTGDGSYRTLDGDKGDYTLSVHMEKQADDLAKITTQYTYKTGDENVTREFSMFVKNLSKGFFDIQDANQNRIGHGNCDRVEKSVEAMLGKKPVTCHYDFTVNGNHYHEAFMARDNKVYRAGGVEYPNKRVAWNEELTKTASSCDSDDAECN